MNVRPDYEVIRNIKSDKGRWALWMGAGCSAEAQIKTVEAICRDIRKDLAEADPTVDATDEDQVQQWARTNLDWDDPAKRYLTCIRRFKTSAAQRVSYFREILRGKPPSFAHHATALLMAQGYLKRTCFTTNFDHLLEAAFSRHPLADFQVIRTDDETRYWSPDADRSFVIKLHGDIDTDNILNTAKETMVISHQLREIANRSVRNGGMVVLGTGAHEGSIRSLFRGLISESDPNDSGSPLSYGLMWAVYMGADRPRAPLAPDELQKRVEEAVQKQVSKDIRELIEATDRSEFCFFPIWGAGRFFFDLVRATGAIGLAADLDRFLDHEMRLEQTFRHAKLSDETLSKHIERLRGTRREPGLLQSESDHEVEHELESPVGPTIRIAYGDITSRAAMRSEKFLSTRRAVVSPEDTYVSAGGGVAYLLLRKAGGESLLNEIAKFSRPIPHRSAIVTSGGDLPVNYVIHAAALEIREGPEYCVTQEEVKATIVSVLGQAAALGIQTLWIPLLGAGAGSMTPEDSFAGILDGVREAFDGGAPPDHRPTITVVVFRRQELRPHVAKEIYDRAFGDGDG